MRYLLFLLILTGCATAEKSFNKAIDKDRNYVAGRTRELWPCVTTEVQTKTDTLFELIEVECPPSGIDTTSKAIIIPIRDTLWREKTTVLKPGKQYVYLPGKTVTVTEKVKDMAEVEQANIRAAEWENTAKRRGKWNLWLIILCLLLGAGHILRSKFK